MKVKIKSLIFNNVVRADMVTDSNNIKSDMNDFENALLSSGVYSTGPVFYMTNGENKETNEVDISYFVPINKPVILPKKSRFTYYKEFNITSGLSYRMIDINDDINEVKQLLIEAAKESKVKIQDSLIYVVLKVDGYDILDVFAPIVGRI